MGTYLSTTEITIERHGIEIQHTDYTAAFAVFAILMLMCIPLALLFEPTVSTFPPNLQHDRIEHVFVT